MTSPKREAPKIRTIKRSAALRSPTEITPSGTYSKGGGRPKRLLPHAKMLLVPMSFSLRWVDYAWKVLHFHCANVILAAYFTLKGPGTHQFTVVFASGRQDLPSDARAFSLTSFEA